MSVVPKLFKYPEELKDYWNIYSNLEISPFIFTICKISNKRSAEQIEIICLDKNIYINKEHLPDITYFKLEQNPTKISLVEFYHYQVLLLFSFLFGILEYNDASYLCICDCIDDRSGNFHVLEYRLYNMILPDNNLIIDAIIKDNGENTNGRILNNIYNNMSECDRKKIFSVLEKDYLFLIKIDEREKDTHDYRCLLAYHQGIFLEDYFTSKINANKN